MLDPQVVIDFDAWVCREEHFHHDKHTTNLTYWEQEWQDSFRGPQHNDLCQLQQYIRDDTPRSMWSKDGNLSLPEASADASQFLKNYFGDAQGVCLAATIIGTRKTAGQESGIPLQVAVRSETRQLAGPNSR